MWVAAAITARDGTCWARAVQQKKRNEGQELFTLAHVLRACRLAACIANLEEDEDREKLSEVKLDDEQRVFVLAESIQSIDLYVVLIHGGSGRPTHVHQCALITCAHILLELAAVLDADEVNLHQLRDAAASVNDVEANNYDVSSAMAVSHASQRTFSGMARFQDWTLEKVVRAPSLVGDSLGPGLDVALILLLPLERNGSVSDTLKPIEPSRRVALSVASPAAQDAATRTLFGRKFFAVCRAGDTSLLEATETDAWPELLGMHSGTVRICETDFVIEHRSSWIMIAFQGKERPACGEVSKSVVEALSLFARYQQNKFAARFEDKESKVRGEEVVGTSRCT